MFFGFFFWISPISQEHFVLVRHWLDVSSSGYHPGSVRPSQRCHQREWGEEKKPKKPKKPKKKTRNGVSWSQRVWSHNKSTVVFSKVFGFVMYVRH
jgi:hypothetical protein